MSDKLFIIKSKIIKMMSRFALFALLFLLGFLSFASAVSLKIVHPKPAEPVTLVSGYTFVIGTVEPENASVVCNGISCDVSKDGAFIGFCPLHRLEEKSWIDEESKKCDAIFEFVIKHEDEEERVTIPVFTPRSPSNFVLSQEIFEPPKMVEIQNDKLIALEEEHLGNIVFVPKGTVLPSFYGNVSNLVCKTSLGTEVSFSTSDVKTIETTKETPPTPWELSILNQQTIKPLGMSDWVWPSKKKVWGFQISSSDGQTHFQARWTIRGDNREIDPHHPFKDLRICLDPGHNPDPGAIGPRGFEERKSTLLLGEQLAKKLEEEGSEVSFSHHDEPLLLGKRHDRFRELKPDLVISLHNNSVGDGQDPRLRHGTETYYLYPWSKPLAQAVHESLLKELETRDLGCIKRNLYVTRFPDCPSVLIEPEYLILPDQEKKFMDPNYRDRLANAILQGIRKFLISATSESIPETSPKSESSASKTPSS
jgi:N-acetylmuramoyl-L-alanine amidase